MPCLARRIANLEDKRPARVVAGPTIALSELDPAVAAVFIARNCDVETMTLSELGAFEAELRRFTE